MMFIETKTSYFLSFLICGLIHSDTVDFWFFSVALTTQQECIAATFIWIVYKLDVARVFSLSTYFNQVYDDNRWWISQYQTLWKGGTTSWFILALILLNSTISLLQSLKMAKYSSSRLNSQTTMMDSIYCFLNWHHWTRTISS